MRKDTCCFTGHRNIPFYKYNEVSQKIESIVRKLIPQGVIYYGSGGAQGFDTIAALTILRLRLQFPQIKLILVLPCQTQTENWLGKDQLIYDFIKSYSDKCVYISSDYTKTCMFERNRHLVNGSQICICYLERCYGGSASTVRYAKKKGLKIINIADIEKNDWEL